MKNVFINDYLPLNHRGQATTGTTTEKWFQFLFACQYFFLTPEPICKQSTKLKL